MKKRYPVATLLFALATAPLASAPSLAGTGAPGASAGIPILFVPLRWAKAALSGEVHAEPMLANSLRLRRDDGWKALEFTPRDSGIGVFVEVEGRVQLERARIAFADGEMKMLDLRRNTRGRGLYQLALFDAGRRVNAVQLRARSLAALSEVGIGLGR